MSDLDELYQHVILERSKNPRHQRLPAQVTHHAQRDNPLCGDRVSVALQLDGNVIAEAGFEAQACAVCVASADVLVELVRALQTRDALELGRELRRIVRGEATVAESLPDELHAFRGVQRFPMRVSCATLPWETLEEALSEEPQPHHAPTPTSRNVTSAHDDVLGQAERWLDTGRKVALATVVETWGSSPRQPGSQLVVNDRNEMLGSVSGGCVEGAVIREAQEVMLSGEPRLLDFGVSNEQAWEVGLACGGRIRVYLERVG